MSLINIHANSSKTFSHSLNKPPALESKTFDIDRTFPEIMKEIIYIQGWTALLPKRGIDAVSSPCIEYLSVWHLKY